MFENYKIVAKSIDGNDALIKIQEFKPDIIYVCTCVRNIIEWPVMTDSKNDVDTKRQALMDKFTGLWDTMAAKYHCPIIQNNFEYPFFRLMGNKDASDYHGRINYVTSLNMAFYDYAQTHDNFYICDVNYISASYGLDKWSDPYYWYMYKYAVAVPAIPYLSFNVAKVIKSIYGKNKKAFNLDLDNTLWGGIVGEDGADNIEIGQETSLAQTYSEFQEYIKLLVRCCKGNQNSGVFPQILEKVLPPLDKGVYAVVYLPHNSHRTVHSAQVIDIRTELTASRLRIVILVFQQPFNLFINNESHPPRGCGGKAHGTTGLHLLHRAGGRHGPHRAELPRGMAGTPGTARRRRAYSRTGDL